MAINSRPDTFKQAHQLKPGDLIALHYGKPVAHVDMKITSDEYTTVILTVPNDEPVRCTKTN
jgi:uncharacterized cupin superfamily protein